MNEYPVATYSAASLARSRTRFRFRAAPGAWTAAVTMFLAAPAGDGAEDLARQYSAAVLPPPDYATFRPPPAGRSYRDPVFGTEIHVITDHHGVVGFNGERAHFSRDDRYFVVGVKPDRSRKSEVWLYDGRTGAFRRALPLEQFDRIRWGHDPRNLVYFTERQVRAHDVETGADTLLREFSEPVGLAGGDGNDFDDRGEWILLNFGPRCTRLAAFNVRTGELGPEFDCPDEKADIDYATITASGRYIAVLGRLRGPSPYNGTGLYERNGRFLRQLAPFHGHAEFGYLHGEDESIFLKVGKGDEEWRARWGLRPRDRFAVSFANGVVTKLLDQGTIYGQKATVAGVNRRFVYVAMESDNNQPGRGWGKYTGEIVEIPLDGSQQVRRLLHHRCRPSTDAPHTFADQPELWVNHAGDRLFFRSNMCLAQGSTPQKYGHDLFMVRLPPRTAAR